MTIMFEVGKTYRNHYIRRRTDHYVVVDRYDGTSRHKVHVDCSGVEYFGEPIVTAKMVTGSAFMTLEQLTAGDPELKNKLDTNRRDHAVMFLARFCDVWIDPSANRSQIEFVLNVITMMNDTEFDDLNLIRKYLRG